VTDDNQTTPPSGQITINLTPRSRAAANVTTEITGDNLTDTVNRAVQIYAYLMKLDGDGVLLFAEKPVDGSRERLVFL